MFVGWGWVKVYYVWADIFYGGWGYVEVYFGWVGGAWTLFMGGKEWVEVYSE